MIGCTSLIFLNSFVIMVIYTIFGIPRSHKLEFVYKLGASKNNLVDISNCFSSFKEQILHDHFSSRFFFLLYFCCDLFMYFLGKRECITERNRKWKT